MVELSEEQVAQAQKSISCFQRECADKSPEQKMECWEDQSAADRVGCYDLFVPIGGLDVKIRRRSTTSNGVVSPVSGAARHSRGRQMMD